MPQPKGTPKTTIQKQTLKARLPAPNQPFVPPYTTLPSAQQRPARPQLPQIQFPQQFPTPKEAKPNVLGLKTTRVLTWNEQTIRQTLDQWTTERRAAVVSMIKYPHPVLASGLGTPSVDDLFNRLMSLPQNQRESIMASGNLETVINLPKKLPYLASAWTPKGEPYYGPEGPMSWAKKLSGRILNPDIYLEGKTYQEKENFYVKYAAEHPEETEWWKQAYGMMGQIVKDNPAAYLKMFLESVKAGPSLVITAMNVPQYAVRKLLAAYSAAGELGMKDWQTSYLVGKPSEYSYLTLLAKGTTGIPFGLPAYSSPTSTVEIKETYKRHMAGSEMIYTMAFDAAKAEEYNKQYAQGKNPDFIAEDLMNPWVELAGSVLLDPLNFLFANWGEAPTKVARIASWRDDVLRVSNPEVSKAIEAAGKASTDADAIREIERVIGLVQNDVSEAKKGMSALSTNFGAFSPVASGKAAIISRRTYPLFRSIVVSSSPEEAAAIFDAMLKVGSQDTDEAARAIAYLARTPQAPMFFSSAGTDGMAFMSSFVDKMGGQKSMLKFLRSAKTPEEALAKIIPTWDDSVKAALPTFSEMQAASSRVARAAKGGKEATEVDIRLAGIYKGMSPGTRAWVGLVNGLDKTSAPVYKIMNSFFSWNYMGINPGYAFRNIFQDSMAIMVEEGPGVAAKNFFDQMGDMFSRGAFTARGKQHIVDMIGSMPEVLMRGKGPHAAEETLKLSEILKEKGLPEILTQFGKKIDARVLAETFESGSSVHIGSYVLERELRKMLDSGYLPDVYTAFRGVGLDEKAADYYIKLVNSNWGDVEKANGLFRQSVATGQLETFRMIKVPTQVGNLLDPLAMRQPFDDLLAKSGSLDEFQRGFEDGLKAIHDKADSAIDAIPRISPMSASESGLMDLEQAIKSGDVSAPAIDARLFEIRTAALNASNSAHNEAVLKTLENLKQAGYDTQPAYEFLYRQEGIDVATRAPIGREMTAKLFGENGIFKISKGKTSEELTELWKNIRIPEGWTPLGNVPKTLTGENFRDLIYGWWAKETRNFWWKSGMQRSVVSENAVRLVTDAVEGLTEQAFISPEWLRAEKMRREMDIWFRVNNWEDVRTLYGEDLVKMASERLPNATLKDMDWNALSFYGWKKGPRALINAVNKDRRLAGLVEYIAGEGEDIYTKVPFTEAVQAIAKRLKGLEPPLPEDAVPFLSQYVSKNETFIAEELTKWSDGVAAHWGETKPVFTNPQVEKILNEIATITKPRLEQGRAGALAVAIGERNWLLHAYDDQTYAERALAHMYLFPYWYTRSAIKWPIRLMENPEYLLAYSKYRKFMEQIHAGLPDWWKYNLIISRLPGINLESPIYFNVEQTLNPLYGVTGVDFEDNDKRATQYARAADDMTKLGPSLYTPINWLIAGALWAEGKEEARNKWLGRLIPQTATLKYALYKFNINTGVKYNEFDPFVQMFMGGLDPYEQAPVGRASGAWVDEQVEKAGTVTDARREELYNMYSAQAQDAILARSGPLFEEFVERMADQKAPGKLTSFFLGAGFKTRTQTDLQIDAFWNDYIALENGRDNMSPIDYRNMQAKIGQAYPWKDAVLLARLPDDSRYRSFSYGVLARIAPGQQDEFFPSGNEAGPLGISGDMIDEFYESKGDFSIWTSQDKERFTNGMVDLAALLAIPDYATQTEWNTAKDTYAQLKKKIALSLSEAYNIDPRTGEDRTQGVWEKVYYYYRIEDNAEKDKFITTHPEVEKAMNLLSEGVMADKLLTQYYGGLETIERYYTSKMYDELYKKFPATDPKMETVGDEWSYYYDLKIAGGNIQEDVLARTPGLKQYMGLMEEKKTAMAQQFPDMQTLWDTYDYAKWIGRITGDYSKADAYYDLNPKLKAYSDASKSYDRQIVGYLAQSMGLQSAIDLESLYNQWQNLATDAAYAYRDAHPEMDAYTEEKAKMIKNVMLQIGALAKNLPEVPQANIRSDFTPMGTTQLRLAVLAQPKPKMTLDDYLKTYKISDETWKAIKKYLDGDKPLPAEVKDELDYLSDGNYMNILFDLATVYYR